ncbi:MAG: phosphoglucosamine mutase [Syntrophomonadaceae bacterium]|nr:phosphoglucosamine mutase [Syntrophomonadaceae bacterium]
MGNLFGTDGVRGVANVELTPEIAFRLGRAGAYVLSREVKRPQIVIGKDTRISGDMLEAALMAGICSVGADVYRVGILPTPGIAYLTRSLRATAGVVISASHNPVVDNGIKFFAGNGYKLPDAVEEEIERLVITDKDELPRPMGGEVGRVYEVEGASQRYLEYLKTTTNVDLQGLTIVVDGANGAAYEVAPRLFQELGARVIPINCSPNGININASCGSTYPGVLQAAVIEHRADLGISHDGDADRVIAVDEQGNLVDGDFIMVICGLHLARQRALPLDTVVVTVMSNLGLHLALRQAGVRTLETKVGDRYVLEEMLRTGAKLGGEQSGHVIFLEHNTTGDGILTALQLMSVMQETGLPLSTLAQQMTRLPQVLVNVRVKDKNALDTCQPVQDSIQQASQRLGDTGRVLVRPSGTEPLIRVMAEGPNEDELRKVVEDIVRMVERHLG